MSYLVGRRMQSAEVIQMGGSLAKGYCVIGGVVKVEVKEFFDKLVKAGKFESRSQVVGHILMQYAKKHEADIQDGDNDA